jgi:ubiquitin carboxyl-terminal hydrolase MINDY-1/2
MSQETPTMQTSLAEVWYLKDIKFDEQRYRIITQNFNGYASFYSATCALIMQYSIDPVHSLQYVRAFYLVSKIVGRVM